MKRLALFLLLAPAALASDLVGPASCRACHAEAYRIWAAGPHARAAQALTPEQRRPLCLQCHARDEQRSGQADVQGVSCETCHGGESPSLKPFDPKEAMQRIDHWTADRAARKPKVTLLLKEK